MTTNDRERLQASRSNAVAKKIQQLGRELQVFNQFRFSQRGVPHLVVRNPFRNTIDYSVGYFAGTRSWRIFWPYPGTTERVDVQGARDVKQFFRGENYVTVEIRKCTQCDRKAKAPDTLCRYCRREEV